MPDVKLHKVPDCSKCASAPARRRVAYWITTHLCIYALYGKLYPLRYEPSDTQKTTAMTYRQPLWGYLAHVFTRLITGRASDAPSLRERLIKSAAELERLKSSPVLSAAVREEVAHLVRLVFIWLNSEQPGISGTSDDSQGQLQAAVYDNISAVESLVHTLNILSKKGKAASVSGNELIAGMRDISERLTSQLDHETFPTGREGGGLQEYLTQAEIRELSAALQAKAVSFPEPVRGAISKICRNTAAFLEQCQTSTSLLHPDEFRDLRRYLREADQVAGRLGAVRDAALLERSAAIFERIAEFIAARSQAIDARRQGDLAADLSVLDTLLRMDGK